MLSHLFYKTSWSLFDRMHVRCSSKDAAPTYFRGVAGPAGRLPRSRFSHVQSDLETRASLHCDRSPSSISPWDVRVQVIDREHYLTSDH
jgi:hypothetical protein